MTLSISTTEHDGIVDALGEDSMALHRAIEVTVEPYPHKVAGLGNHDAAEVTVRGIHDASYVWSIVDLRVMLAAIEEWLDLHPESDLIEEAEQRVNDLLREQREQAAAMAHRIDEAQHNLARLRGRELLTETRTAER